MATIVEMEYYASFGSGDSSETFPWEIELEGEAEKAFLRAKKLRIPLEDVPEVQAVWEEAYNIIKEEETQNFIDCDDEYTLELLGIQPVDAESINELVADRDQYTLQYFGLTGMSDEELEEWDANNLSKLPNICDFEVGFEPQNPFDQGYSLELYFTECPEEEALGEDEARETLSELLSVANGNYEEVKDYINRCEDLYEGDDLSALVKEVAVNLGINDFALD